MVSSVCGPVIGSEEEGGVEGSGRRVWTIKIEDLVRENLSVKWMKKKKIGISQFYVGVGEGDLSVDPRSEKEVK